jgi:rhamnogalacturonan endolyase
MVCHSFYYLRFLKASIPITGVSIHRAGLLIIHFVGSHYNSEFSNYIPPGKIFGPWLVYINDGNITDASQRAKLESKSWPYDWVQDHNFQSRGNVSGTLLLSDGRPAAGAAVFLGDEGNTNNQGSTYQYTSFASAEGDFSFSDVRTEKQYTLQAWSNGGIIGDVQTVYAKPNISISRSKITQLGKLVWATSNRTTAWQIGDFDRKTIGFQHGGAPLTHGLSDLTPANFLYVVGKQNSSSWPFAQSAMGNWTILFDVPPERTNSSATLTLSFAGYTSQNGYGLGGDSYILPEVEPTGLNVSVNARYVGTVVSENATDGAIYRSATIAGGYYISNFTIPSGLVGSINARIDL